MKRGFGYYFKNGISTAGSVVYKGGKFFKYHMYRLCSLLGKLIPFFGAIFFVSDMRQAKLARDEKEVSAVRVYESVDTASGFGTAVLVFSIEVLLVLGGVAAFCGLAYGLYTAGLLIGAVAYMSNPEVLAIIFAVPALAAAAIYAIAVLVMLAPAPYIIDSHRGVRAGGVLTASVETMRRSGKVTCFFGVAIPLLIKAVYLFLAGLVTEFIYGLIYNSSVSPEIGILLLVVWCVVALAGYLLLSPVLTLGTHIMLAMLMHDVSLDPEAMSNRTKGVFIRKVTTNELGDSGLDSNLQRLFDAAPSGGDAAPNTKYVPPTDYEPKMRTYTETESEEADEPAHEEPAEEPAHEESAESVRTMPDGESDAAAKESASFDRSDVPPTEQAPEEPATTEQASEETVQPPETASADTVLQTETDDIDDL